MTAAALVGALAAAAPRFTPRDRAEKIRLLDALARADIASPRALHRLHETLCFLAAYPDEADVLRRAREALAAFAARVRRLGPAMRRLDDTGIAGTFLDYPFGLSMARWLARTSPGSADVLWSKPFAESEIEETLSLLVLPSEGEAMSDEGGLGWRRWLRLAKGGRTIERSRRPRRALRPRAAAAGGARAAVRRPRAVDRLATRRDLVSDEGRAAVAAPVLPWPRTAVARPARRARLPVPRSCGRCPRCGGRRRRSPTRLIDAARAAMATRLRELFAFSHANAGDVLVADTARGLRIALIGIVPRERLPLHGYYAYLALKNGVPVSYGAAWQLFGVLEAAFNVFESFRGGESAFIVGEVLRAYRQVFGMRRIVVDPYQIGRDNPEALASGAFYFYRRLGFRSLDPAVERLARAEDEQIRARPSYRSPLAVLRQLASAEIGLSLGGGSRAGAALSASRLGALVTRRVAERWRGERPAALRRVTRQVAGALGVRGWARWTADERRGFAQLAPVVALIEDVARWPAADRRRLAEAMRAKGGPSEAGYVRRLDAIPRLRKSLAAVLGAGDPAGGDSPPDPIRARWRRESTGAR